MKKKYFLYSLVLLLTIFLWYNKYAKGASDYFTPKILATHSNGEHYVGSQTCMECHEDIYNSHIKTAHYNTSAPASLERIKGSFIPGHNTLELQEMRYQMISKNNFFYEQGTYKYEDKNQSLSKIDIVIGSGVKGQSYLSWDNDRLYQLQTSYYTPTNSWINSPNYPEYSTRRPISSDCLKCHVTFAKNKDFSKNAYLYNKESIILGVDCERCHLPSSKHVVFHRENPDIKESKFMLKFSELSRKQRVDACAVCHSGLRIQRLKGNPFSFLSGENLEEYSKNFFSGRPNKTLDVHGNQYGLLTSSKCYKETPKMDCTTCHNSHKKQRGNITHFIKKCIECHTTNESLCTEDPAIIKSMGNNCIACHMPVAPSNSMKVKLNKDSIDTAVYVRTHLIAVYPIDN
ncbi:MAG: multiheme c-type cytochrome [Cellulophaga sp.]